ncbi:MAG: hypothetical protein Q7S16_05210, partial [bacterium]|nr:hypothetical protein [bacterium]
SIEITITRNRRFEKVKKQVSDPLKFILLHNAPLIYYDFGKVQTITSHSYDEGNVGYCQPI